MSEGIQKLKENLEQQVAVYKQLYALEQEKSGALVINDIQKIEEITAREGKFLKTAAGLESERLLCVKQIAGDLERTPEDLTLAELSERFPVLKGIRSELQQLVKDIRDIESTNAQLLIQAMRVVNYTLDLLTYEQSNTYGPQNAAANNRSALNNRAYEDGKKKQLMDWRI